MCTNLVLKNFVLIFSSKFVVPGGDALLLIDRESTADHGMLRLGWPNRNGSSTLNTNPKV